MKFPNPFGKRAQQVVIPPVESTALVPVTESKEVGALGATNSILTWQKPPVRPLNYELLIREGYNANELVFACVEEICTSAAEPKLVAYKGDTKITNHPLLTLLNNPNPYMSGFQYWAFVLLFKLLNGNSYTEVVFNGRGKPAELWLFRPDQVNIVPGSGRANFIQRYDVGFSPNVTAYPVAEIMHSKTRSGLNPYYGFGPMQVLLSRVDTDNYMREFTKAFFFNAAVPAGMLNIEGTLDEEEREQIRRHQGDQFGGPRGWWTDMVIEGSKATYTPMGMPLGARGVAYPELDEIMEARIPMVFGVPPSLIGARISLSKANYAAKVEDRQMFWYETLMPKYREEADVINLSLVPYYPDIDRVEFDIMSIRALQEETDKLHARVRNDAAALIITREEAREQLGLPRKAPAGDTWIGAGSTIAFQGDVTPQRTSPAPSDGHYPALPNGSTTEEGQAGNGGKADPYLKGLEDLNLELVATNGNGVHH